MTTVTESPAKDIVDEATAAKPSADSLPTATFGLLMSKPQRTMTVPVTLQDDEGKATKMGFKIQAISSSEYDTLLSEHAPTKKQQAEGAVYNGDTFPPALVAACSVEPKLTREQADRLWANESWAIGELLSLFRACMGIVQADLDVPFNFGD